MLDRRCFLKFVGGVGVGILATPAVWKTLDDSAIWSQNWSWIPEPEGGVPTYVRTISKLSPSNLGIKVRLLGDRPVNAYGDPEHPLSQGAINALAASEVQLLYSPARLRQPLKRNGESLTAVSWDEALALLAEGLKKARGKGGICTVSGDPTSIVNEILQSISGSNSFLMPGEEQPAQAALNLMGGKGRLGYDFAHSDMVLAINAAVLESWGTVVSNRRAWSAGRPAGKEPTFRLAYASAIQDNTAAGADWWLPMRPGKELVVALGIANLLYKAGRNAACADSEAFVSLAANWTPAAVETASGVPAKKLEEVAAALLAAKRPLVIVGSPLNQGGSTAAIMAGVACNILLGNLNALGGLQILPQPKPVLAGCSHETLLSADLAAYVQKIAETGKAPDAVLFYDANPVYALPGSAVPLFEKAGFKVAMTCFMDETAAQCELVLPMAMGLERYDDAETPYGCGEIIYSLATPVTSPKFEARPAGEILLDVAYQLGVLPEKMDILQLLKARAQSMEADWTDLSNGRPFIRHETVPQKDLHFNADVLSQAVASLDAVKDAICLAPAVRLGVGTSETGIPPYAVKLVNAREVNHKESIVHMNSATAAQLGVSDGTAVTITGPGGSCKALALVDESVCTGALSMLSGMGHTAFDAFSKNKGSNLLQLARPVVEAGSGSTMWSTITVKVAKV